MKIDTDDLNIKLRRLTEKQALLSIDDKHYNPEYPDCSNQLYTDEYNAVCDCIVAIDGILRNSGILSHRIEACNI